ncbi:hypothetical protein WME94_35165 [Sorangium sp. So ce429]
MASMLVTNFRVSIGGPSVRKSCGSSDVSPSPQMNRGRTTTVASSGESAATTRSSARPFNRLYSLFLEYRLKTGCFTFIAIYVKAIRSDYLANGDPSKRFCELMLYCSIDPDKMTEPVLEEIVSQIDDVTISPSLSSVVNGCARSPTKRACSSLPEARMPPWRRAVNCSTHTGPRASVLRFARRVPGAQRVEGRACCAAIGAHASIQCG